MMHDERFFLRAPQRCSLFVTSDAEGPKRER
jgi:hypothetical protein